MVLLVINVNPIQCSVFVFDGLYGWFKPLNVGIMRLRARWLVVDLACFLPAADDRRKIHNCGSVAQLLAI